MRIVATRQRFGALCIRSLLMVAICSHAAMAGDGRLEINQASVDAAGGFPYSIIVPGSYVLTSNLTVSDPNTTALQIQPAARGAILDLNGFTISGPASCARSDVGGGDLDTSCSNTGSGQGINVLASDVTIRNGVIRGMGQYGITDSLGGPRTTVEDVRVIENGFNGMILSAQGKVINCHAFRNGMAGIQVGEASIAANNVAAENGGFGIIANGVVRGNSAQDNDGNGVHAVGNSVVTQNVAVDNDTVGLSLSNSTGYFGNTMNNNGTDVAAGINLGQNMCGGAACP